MKDYQAPKQSQVSDRAPDFKFRWEKALGPSGLKSNVFRTAIMLGTHANQYGTNAHPGVKRLSQLTDQSDKTVRRHLEQLEAQGWIEKYFSGKGGKTEYCNAYRLTFPIGHPDDPLTQQSIGQNQLLDRASIGQQSDLTTVHVNSPVPSASSRERSSQPVRQRNLAGTTVWSNFTNQTMLIMEHDDKSYVYDTEPSIPVAKEIVWKLIDDGNLELADA